MYLSRYIPCPACGASVDVSDDDVHTCDEERRLDFQLFQLRHEFAAFEREVAEYLDSPQGRFEAWYAARERTRGR